MATSLPSPKKCLAKQLSLELLFEIEARDEQEANNQLDKKWHEKAEKELGETAEIAKERISQLRDMLENTNLIPDGRRDDAFLLRYLRAKKFDTEKAFRMMAKYYSMKKQSPELFKVSPASQLRDLLSMQIQLMVPTRDQNGRKLYIFRVKKCDPYKCPVETVFRTNVLALENAVREPETQIAGIVVLLDMAGAGLGHAKFLAPNLSRRTVEVVQEAFPLRFKAFHILNEPFYFDAILAVLKPFLKEKIRRRIFLHGSSLASLHKCIPKDILPAEYGGTQPKFDNTEWRQKLLDDEDYFTRLETFGSIEDLTKEFNGNHADIADNKSTDDIPFSDTISDAGSEYELCEDYSDPGGDIQVNEGNKGDYVGDK